VQTDSDSTSGREQSGVSLQSRVAELESEVSRLREQLGKAKEVNDAMWETVVRQVVEEGKEKNAKGKERTQERNGDEEEDGGRRKKRGRV